MPNELYRDFIDGKADEIINSLGGTITPAPANAELYRDFLDRKFDDVINAIDNVKIKSFTYTGDGQSTNNIVFPTLPKYVLSIQGKYMPNLGWIRSDLIIWGLSFSTSDHLHANNNKGSTVSEWSVLCSYDDNTKTLTLEGNNQDNVFNTNGVTFTVLYI